MVLLIEDLPVSFFTFSTSFSVNLALWFVELHIQLLVRLTLTLVSIQDAEKSPSLDDPSPSLAVMASNRAKDRIAEYSILSCVLRSNALCIAEPWLVY